MLRMLVFLTIGFLALSELGAQERRSRQRRSFDPVAYLKRLDANGNGALEPTELSDRSKEFVQGLGFSTEETLSIDKIAAKINGDKADSEKAKQAEAGGQPQRTVTRKVPGFGVEAPARQGVADFVAKKQASESELKGKYGDRIMEQVEAAMERYDKNKDGKIDQAEASEGRWGQPEPKESDLDKDGNLTRQEMAERYYKRERNSNQTEDNRGSESNRDSSRSNRDSDRDSNRDSNRDSDSNNGRDSDSKSETSDSSGEAPRQPAGDRYRRYADQLIEQYDKNKDGGLSKEEMSEMKQRPENADLDGNGTVSAGELTDALANGNMSSGSKSGSSGSPTSSSSNGRGSKGESTSSNSSRGSDEGGSSRGSSRSGSPFSFAASDKSGDGQVQMHEFASDWNDEKLEEFRSYDLNGDGVITNAEYRERKK